MLCKCGCGQPAEYAARHVRSTLRTDERLRQFEIRDMGFDTPCHIWTGNLTGSRPGAERGRYGKIFIHGRYHIAHRYLYEREVGPIPPGKHLHHLCHQTRCVNTEYLRPTTASENNRLKRTNKLTEADIPLIRASKLRSEDLAQILNVSPSLIYQIRSGDIWGESA